ncbi:neutral zinc metallopeptidase [Jannaschia sp. S6380]|uniref:KPN_02809 family neutral zinc metallopeptidase n=1 Tax=Jannaschia sp. S6380 TaxID=2926408 RepID=UPI001FF258E2|nr:neutral zinc metallopeptidase [Jannaschia sp. S6380]MCK0166439.1 neutral zinc metallopeptidase [Jannaschia sp. S6380]
MRWRGRRGSSNIEDRRGRRGGGRAMSGGIGGLGLVAVLLIGWFFGIDVSPFLQGGGGFQTQAPAGPVSEAEQQEAQFVSVVLADTEEVWRDVFAEQVGEAYRPPILVLYSGVTSSPCGGASGATGPFYCPADRKAYIDTAFFTTLDRRMGAGGDFAAAYVVAHEVAHHVQNELGILGQANQIRAQSSEAQSNAISVRVELQADCLAGIWAREAQERFGILERGDLEEAVNAARRIGDDHLQRSAGRVPMPHTFTHGTSEQRARWFRTGYETGRIPACDTFSAERL